MSVKHVGISPALEEQPKYKFTKNRSGLVTILTAYACPASLMVDLMPPIGAEHSRFRFATLDEITGVREEGDLAFIDCVFKGPEPGSGSEPVAATRSYQLVASTREEPIETHTLFKTIEPANIALVRKAVQDGKPPPILVGPPLDLYYKLARGQESFMRRGVVWRETSTSAASFGTISNVGKIDTPPGGAPSNSPGNWILLSVEQSKEGSAFKQIREWMASGPEGWDPDIYGS